MANGTLTPTARHLRTEIAGPERSGVNFAQLGTLQPWRTPKRWAKGSKPNEAKKSLRMLREAVKRLVILEKGDVRAESVRLNWNNGVKPASILVWFQNTENKITWQSPEVTGKQKDNSNLWTKPGAPARPEIRIL